MSKAVWADVKPCYIVSQLSKRRQQHKLPKIAQLFSHWRPSGYIRIPSTIIPVERRSPELLYYKPRISGSICSVNNFLGTNEACGIDEGTTKSENPRARELANTSIYNRGWLNLRQGPTASPTASKETTVDSETSSMGVFESSTGVSRKVQAKIEIEKLKIDVSLRATPISRRFYLCLWERRMKPTWSEPRSWLRSVHTLFTC